ncbi:AfsA-related hotdog domain-containing protein [Diaphorobacter sp.]|uniref:AfsA-related hotdog domain-containing protein n=1 Tax=Diaphorobacter sp. TaxID=1934310 RepID=UPI0028AED217|nr:AfsA-related hotdog domain-containing protein [Diaphorobacter sp.]
MAISIVVPKGFSQFATNEHLLLYESLMESLHAGNPSAGPLAGRTLVAGQGLDETQISHAWHIGTSKGLVNEFQHWFAWRRKRPASKPLVHKLRPENSLISAPEQHEEGSFVAELLLHEQNELMRDHLTGQHVQGMVLTEACRQMFLAVTEKFFLHDYAAVKRYFVFHTMTMRFDAFAFPLPAQIRYRILEQQRRKPDQLSFHATMDIHQGGQIVSSMDTKFTVFDEEFISQREKKLATNAIQHSVKQLRSLVAARKERETAPSSLRRNSLTQLDRQILQ